MEISARKQLKGTIKQVIRGSVNGEVVVDIGGERGRAAGGGKAAVGGVLDAPFIPVILAAEIDVAGGRELYRA